ncbi:hypothetical protein F5Y03DRAFT_411258 [Xylaria venustula]|nr:hypothetical protein F5Y03DRAFT_411258 [Xylaria venustula]
MRQKQSPPLLLRDHIRQRDGVASFADILEVQRRGMSEHPDEAGHVNMPVVFPVHRSGQLQNTVQIFIERDSPPSYKVINQSIFVAAQSLLWYLFRERITNTRLAEAMRELNFHMLNFGQLYLIWDIGIQAILLDMRQIRPTPGVSDIYSPITAEWEGIISTSRIPRRISYIFVPFDILGLADELAETSTKILHQPQPDKDEKDGPGPVPGTAATPLSSPYDSKPSIMESLSALSLCQLRKPKNPSDINNLMSSPKARKLESFAHHNIDNENNGITNVYNSPSRLMRDYRVPRNRCCRPYHLLPGPTAMPDDNAMNRVITFIL